MTPLSKIIRERRTIHTFTNEPVSKELIIDLLNDAVWAPNHGLREPWRFLFVSTEVKGNFIEYLLQAFPNDQQEKMRTYFHSQASAFLIVIMPEDPRQKKWEEDFAASAAIASLLFCSKAPIFSFASSYLAVHFCNFYSRERIFSRFTFVDSPTISTP
jgi:nitroreductase